MRKNGDKDFEILQMAKFAIITQEQIAIANRKISDYEDVKSCSSQKFKIQEIPKSD